MKFILSLVTFVILLNLANFLDITYTEKKSEIIAVLGGGRDIRIKKALELYKKGYSLSNKLIYMGGEYTQTVIPIFYFSEYLIENGVKKENIVNIKDGTNTMEELDKIKEYLVENNIKSVLIVSHPSHSRRVKILANFFADYKKANIKISFSSADHTNIWNKNLYFLNIESIKLVFLEYLKIIYNLIKYSIL